DFAVRRPVFKKRLVALMGYPWCFSPRWRWVLGFMWNAEALLPAAGEACALRYGCKPPAGFKPAGGYGSQVLNGGGPTRGSAPTN
ncbi:MAG: hypothetical protein ABUK16_10385, partial [Anaerolineales bacterium]